MVILSSGPIENNAALGIRPSQAVTAKVVNSSLTTSYNVLTQGYYLDGVKTLYVSEQFTVAPGAVSNRAYFADLDAFEFIFNVDAVGNAIEVSLWGKGSSGMLTDAQRLVLSELSQVPLID